MESAGSSPVPSETHGGGLPPASHSSSERQDQEHKVQQEVVPPYWMTHARTSSTLSAASLHLGRPRIALEDHSEEQSEQSKALWARHVNIDDYTVVQGSAPGIGAYVVWNCIIETLDGGSMVLRKRYSEFDRLRKDLASAFPHAEGAMPPLPRKSVISKFQPKFLEHRRVGLQYFLNCVLLNPEFSGSPILKDFLFP